MTRDEEIEQVAKDIARKFYNEENPNIAYRSVRQGILWADQHPKDNLVDIDKAVEWIDNNVNHYIFENEYGETYIKYTFTEDFIKAMKGE